MLKTVQLFYKFSWVWGFFCLLIYYLKVLNRGLFFNLDFRENLYLKQTDIRFTPNFSRPLINSFLCVYLLSHLLYPQRNFLHRRFTLNVFQSTIPPFLHRHLPAEQKRLSFIDYSSYILLLGYVL